MKHSTKSIKHRTDIFSDLYGRYCYLQGCYDISGAAMRYALKAIDETDPRDHLRTTLERYRESILNDYPQFKDSILRNAIELYQPL